MSFLKKHYLKILVVALVAVFLYLRKNAGPADLKKLVTDSYLRIWPDEAAMRGGVDVWTTKAQAKRAEGLSDGEIQAWIDGVLVESRKKWTGA